MRAPTVLVSGCFLEGLDPLGNDRYLRVIRFLNYYQKIKDHLEFDKIVLFDNASSGRFKSSIDYYCNIDVYVFDFKERLVRGEGDNNYPYCWRNLYAMKQLIGARYQKIIFIDSDAFVLTKRLADYIHNCNQGWVSFWDETYGFPESSMHILNEDAFPIYERFCSVDWKTHYLRKQMETTLPFTHIERRFRCGRFGEKRIPQERNMDFYGQACIDIPLKYENI